MLLYRVGEEGKQQAIHVEEEKKTSFFLKTIFLSCKRMEQSDGQVKSICLAQIQGFKLNLFGRRHLRMNG